MSKEKNNTNNAAKNTNNTTKNTNNGSSKKTITICGIIIAICVCIACVCFMWPKDKGTGETYAVIDIQDYGTVTVKLDKESAPITVDNFVTLAESGFYDGLTFHRIIANFMMQGGDPDGNGTGGSENKIEGEFSANGHNNSLSHTRGAISMARSQEYNSASSQFFIVHQDSTYLDGQYAVFGYVTEGMEVVDAVCEAAQPIDDNGTIPSEAQPVIKSVKIKSK